MSIYLLALISAVVGGINPSFSKIKDDLGAFFGGWLWRSLVAFIVILLILYYWWHPALGTLTLGGLFPVITLIFTINVAATFGIESSSSYDSKVEATPLYMLGIGWIWVLIAWIGGSSLFQADALSHAIKPKHMTLEEANFTSVKHLRPISREQAVFWMNKITSAEVPGRPGSIIGSSFSIDEEALTIQKSNGRLYWVAPLEFTGYFRWQAEKGQMPLYVKLLAEESSVKSAELVQTEKPMRYATSAREGYNLQRHIYQSGYAGYYIEDYSFEIDDAGKPYWVVSLLSPRVFNGGKRLQGVVIVDPVSGSIQPYMDLSKIPDWVDRAVPDDVAKDWASDWGMLSQGFLHGTFNKSDCYEVIGDPIEIFGDDGHIWWHIAMKAANKDSGSVAGFMHINTRSGETRWFRVEGAATYERALENAKAEYPKYLMNTAHGTEPIPYILSGRLVYIFPAVGSDELFQKFVIVDALTSAVAIEADGNDALRSFRSKLGERHNGINNTSGSTPPTKSITGTVFRIGSENDGGQLQYFITLKEDPNHIFIGPRSKGRQLPLTKPGDGAEIEFNDTSDEEVSFVKFHNTTLDGLKKLDDTSKK